MSHYWHHVISLFYSFPINFKFLVSIQKNEQYALLSVSTFDVYKKYLLRVFLFSDFLVGKSRTMWLFGAEQTCTSFRKTKNNNKKIFDQQLPLTTKQICEKNKQYGFSWFWVWFEQICEKNKQYGFSWFEQICEKNKQYGFSWKSIMQFSHGEIVFYKFSIDKVLFIKYCHTMTFI